MLNKIIILIFKFNKIYLMALSFGKHWGLGIGDWGLGIGDW